MIFLRFSLKNLYFSPSVPFENTSIFLPFFVVFRACLISKSVFILFFAEIFTIKTPNNSDNLSVSSLILFFSNSSAMLTAMTYGIPKVDNSPVKYRFLSKLVPSTIFITTSGGVDAK